MIRSKCRHGVSLDVNPMLILTELYAVVKKTSAYSALNTSPKILYLVVL